MRLLPFQRRFVQAVERCGNGRAVLSLPRGNGKSWLAGHLVARCLTPGDVLRTAGAEAVLLSGSFDQARFVFRFAKAMLEDAGVKIRVADSRAQMSISGPDDTTIRVLSSKGRSAFGLVGCRLAIGDEPGALG